MIEIDNKKMWESLRDLLFERGSYNDAACIDFALEKQGLTIRNGEIVSIESGPLKIKAGKNYMCIKDVYMSDSGRFVYLTGKIYKSECECCITDEDGNRIHAWDESSASEYFRPATREEVLEAKHGITGISTKKAEGKLGEMIKEKTATSKPEPATEEDVEHIKFVEDIEKFHLGQEKEEIPRKPKSKVGDWIIDMKDHEVFMISKDLDNTFRTNVYRIIGTDGEEFDIPKYNIEDNYRSWTIQDAKDGDVLYDGADACIFRKTMQDDDGIMCDTYCGIDCNNNFVVNEPDECWCFAYHLTPATKEQRDLLFAKMKEAGYEWDTEKKELKKIVIPIFNIGDTIAKKHNSDILYFGSFTITDITGVKYWYNDRIICDITEQNEWEIYEPIRQTPA